MGLPQLKTSSLYTVEEYLEFERAAEERHEFIDGQIYQMAGESLNHSTINANLIGQLHAQLRGKPCRALSPNMKLRSGPFFKEQKTNKGFFSYADVTVVCGQPQFHDRHQDVLLNPTVVIEVLSTSTENFDRGEKFLRYRTHLESLLHYVLVWQEFPLVEMYTRQPGGGWLLTEARGLEGALDLPAIDCRLALAEVYDRVAFPEPEPEPEGEGGHD
jgi:Uma2 family endonuclease